MKKILFITTLFITNCLIAQEWISIGKENGNEYYYKPNTNDTAWIKTISSETLYIDSKGKETTVDGYTVVLWKFDCDDKKIGLRQVVVYSKQGKVLNSVSKKDYSVEMDYVIPDSLGGDFLNAFCMQK